MLGDLVRANRRRLGLSQEDLADRTGVSVRGIRKIEAHRTGTPRPATVRLLADAFELTGAARDHFCEAAAAPTGPAPAALTAPLPSSAAAATSSPVLVGRVGELAALRAGGALGRFHLVWVSGEAGAGKSALARALAADLARQGWQTVRGGSPEVDGAPPAWAWADAVRGLVCPDVDQLRALLDGGSTPPFRLARAVVEVLRRAAGPRPLLVVLDDVHRAGEETLQILRYAATELAGHPILVVATLRPTEAGPALTATRAALAGPRSSRLDLGGLAEPEVGRLLHAQLGVPVAAEVVRLITARTGGNPLFVGETARLILDRGVAAATELVPDGVSDVLRRRLAGLPAAAQAVLRTAAVFGIDVETEVLLSMDPAGADAVLDGLEAALHADLLTEPAPGVVRFSHVLVRDTIYRDLSGPRRSALHARVLDILERLRPGDLGALAHHALASAGAATALAAAARAGRAADVALATCAYSAAVSLLTGALEVLDRSADPAAGLRRDLLCLLMSAQGHSGNVRGARATRQLAVRQAREIGDHRGLARAYTAYDAPTLWTHRPYRQPDRNLIDGLEAMLAAVPYGDPATRCRLLATLVTEIDDTDPERTGEASEEALDLANGLDDPALLCRALNARYRYVATLGPDHWPELDDIGEQQLKVATAEGLSAYRTQAHHILGMAALGRNDLDRAQEHLDRAVAHATSGQLTLALGILAMFQGLRELVAGRFDQAERSYAPVIAQLRHVGNPNMDEAELLIRFCVEHARPGSEGRERMTALADQAGPVHERFGEAVAEPYVRLLIAAGRLEQARAIWRPGTALPRDHYWFRWTALRAENALHLGDLATAATCYQQLLPWRGHLPGLLHAHLTLGPVDHTLGDLAVALGRPAAAARHYADAAALAERLGAGHWAERARAALA